MFVLFLFYVLSVNRNVVCKTTNVTHAQPSTIPKLILDFDNMFQQSTKIISSCDVRTRKDEHILHDRNCIYQNSTHSLCFYIGKKSSSYEDAPKKCEKQGMELASITKPLILDVLTRLILKHNFSGKNSLLWVDIPDSTWESIGNWSTDYKQYYNETCNVLPKDVQKRACSFVTRKMNSTKSVLRQMKDTDHCRYKLDIFCQVAQPVNNRPLLILNNENISESSSVNTIIVATSIGVLFLLVTVGIVMKLIVQRIRTHSHDRMLEASKSENSIIGDKKSEDKYAEAVQTDSEILKETERRNYLNSSELSQCSNETIDLTQDQESSTFDRDPMSDSAPGQTEEPCYFVLNKESSVESLQHTYEDCAFKDVPSSSSLPMASNPLALTLPASGRVVEADDNVYDWPDLLQPTNYSAKTRRTQSETEPQYFSLEIEDDESENIYDSVFPIDEPLKKSPKQSRTKHLSLQRKTHKSKQSHAKSRYSIGNRK